jgi:hypothetical protein
MKKKQKKTKPAAAVVPLGMKPKTWLEMTRSERDA